MGNTLEMAEITNLQGNLHMLTLHDIRMATSAMELYAPFHHRKVLLVIKIDIPLGNDDFGFNESPVVTTRLETVLIGDIRERSAARRSREEFELSCKSSSHIVLMALEAGNFVVSGRLPLLVVGSHKMTNAAVFRLGEYDLQYVCIETGTHKGNDNKKRNDFLLHGTPFHFHEYLCRIPRGLPRGGMHALRGGL